MQRRRMAARVVVALLGVVLALPAGGQGQALPWTTPAAPAPAPDAKAAPGAKTFSQEELDQLLAPIALYPDALLAQVLMASTYPLEVVAGRALGQGESRPQGQGARGRAAAAAVGPERQVARGVPAGARR